MHLVFRMGVILAPDKFLASDSPDRAHVLVAICSMRGLLATIAAHICEQIRAEGHIADLACANSHAMPTPPDYELVVVGLTGMRLQDRPLLHWLAEVRAFLVEMPVALFVLGVPEKLARTLARELDVGDWHPGLVAAFSADSEASTRWFARRVTQLLRGVPSLQ